MKLLCLLLGHRAPPPPLDRISSVLGTGWAPCARCGEPWFFKGKPS